MIIAAKMLKPKGCEYVYIKLREIRQVIIRKYLPMEIFYSQ